MTVRVAFPVLFATLRLHLDKGRQWSVVEHLLLHALCERPHSAGELAAEGNLPRRLVIEVVIRLMRAGPISRKASFAIDKISGTVFRSRDLTLYTPNRLQKLKASGEIIELPGQLETLTRPADEIIGLLLDDDEHYRGLDPSGARLVDWYAVVTVHGD